MRFYDVRMGRKTYSVRDESLKGALMQTVSDMKAGGHTEAFVTTPEGKSYRVYNNGQPGNDGWVYAEIGGGREANIYPRKKARAKKPVASESVRSDVPVDLEALAADMVRFAREWDPHGFDDGYDDPEDSFEDTLRGISTLKGVRDAMRFLEDDGTGIDWDPELDRLHRSIMARLRILERHYSGAGSPSARSRWTIARRGRQ